jgi:hypothetical protein
VGDTVIAGAGIFGEHVTLAQRMTLRGQGATTVIDPSTDGPGISIGAGGTALDPLTIASLKVSGVTGSGNTGSGIVITSGSYISLNQVESSGNGGSGVAINATSAIDGLTLDQVNLNSNGLDGFRIPTSMTSMDGLTISSSHLDNNTFAGIEIYGPPSTGSVTNVSITDSTFSGDLTKGIYAERLDHAILDGITVNASGTSGAFSAGIDLNLKKQAFATITIQNSTITNSGTGDATNGVGLTIKSRDDGSNGPTSLAGVVLTHNIITGNQYGLRLGETGKNNVGPTGVQVTRNNISGNVLGHGVINVTQTTDDTSCNWWGDSSGPAGSGPGIGNSVSAGLTFTPWLVSNDLGGPCAAITVASAALDASGNEGTTISTSGSFSDSSATITADNLIGTFTDNHNGTWSWSYLAPDQFGPTTITVTGHGQNGTVVSDAFDASAVNVAPTATFNAPASAVYSTSFNLSLTSPIDVAADTLTYYFDCGSGYGTTGTSSASCTAPATPGPITVKGAVLDEDGGVTEYSASVAITQQGISLTPGSKDFGSVLVGTDSAPFSFTVKNTGTADLTVGTVGLSGLNPGHFGIDANHCFVTPVLAPNATCTIDVFFSPGSAGSKSATLVVASNDPNHPSVSSTLTGSGGVASNGIITITLDAHPNGSQSFSFNGSGGIGPFASVDDGTPANVNNFSKPAGDYTISVGSVSGWALIGLTCDAPETIKMAHRKVTIHLGAGENVSCTFTESKRQPDALIGTTSGGPLVGDGIYSSTVLPSQTQSQAIARSHTSSFFVTLQNDGLDTDSFKLLATISGSNKFKVRFFVGSTDITARLLAGTYSANGWAPGGQLVIEIRVTAKASTKASATRNIDLSIRSKTASAAKDIVRAHVTRA